MRELKNKCVLANSGTIEAALLPTVIINLFNLSSPHLGTCEATAPECQYPSLTCGTLGQSGHHHPG